MSTSPNGAEGNSGCVQLTENDVCSIAGVYPEDAVNNNNWNNFQ